MDKHSEKQVNDLSLLFHEILFLKNNLSLGKDFSNLDKFSENEISIINILGHNDNVTLKDIINVIKVPKSTLTGLINKLEKNNYVKRSINDVDKRSYKLELTEEGIKVSKEHDEFDRTVSEKVLSALNDSQDRELFIKLFGEIINNLKSEIKENK
ncbi:MarR family winged helix-turn-helix transcriptional regulator [Clostridium massiliamazoniense]|uniref:MarR family winged helix-turn-helix transcriptional regulator n=1 Tax=Clostridium massiliamazoniense TaxID=1347366 RepID=UPI0006D85678|nr:MarR family transcriptional regulator [Clostridium massiliamazoniense]